MAAFDKAIALAPTLAFAYFGKAVALEEEGRFSAALNVVGAAISLVPTEARPWELKGKLLSEAKNFTAAYAAFRQALVLDPGRASVFVQRADAEIAEGRSAEAIADLERYPTVGQAAAEVHGKFYALRSASIVTAVPDKCEKALGCADKAARATALSYNDDPVPEPPSTLSQAPDKSAGSHRATEPVKTKMSDHEGAVLQTACDLLAASKNDPDRRASGKDIQQIDPDLAIAACEKAQEAWS